MQNLSDRVLGRADIWQYVGRVSILDIYYGQLTANKDELHENHGC